ncbi:hypothetical protein GH714_005609 [Hevea brasiliensis]|uniref:Uncharacterized protein n=1 Tax=Hevea brasiliensis TaxID=3981 RepID=A0A6A6MYZ5_HEVBR|nr:hypothetical protein GH714_005609 [Hevea brasiliensis]
MLPSTIMDVPVHEATFLDKGTLFQDVIENLAFTVEKMDAKMVHQEEGYTSQERKEAQMVDVKMLMSSKDLFSIKKFIVEDAL